MSTWKLKAKKGDYERMAEVLGITNTFAKVLTDNDILNTKDYYDFIDVALTSFTDFSEAKGVNLAIDALQSHIEQNNKIFLLSDYDCDGVTSTVIMLKGLIDLFPTIDIDYIIPHRVHDGYGMNNKMIDKASENGANLIITLDNGISNIDEINYARSLGIDVIIIDHHVPVYEPETNEEILPSANVVVDPKQKGCNYPFKEMCTAGLAFRFVTETSKKIGKELTNFNELLEFSSIGTVADVVDLVDDNRIIVKNGLNAMNKSIDNLGLSKLVQKLDIRKDIDSETYGFQIGPMINAIGRLSHAKYAVKLFMSDDIDEVNELVELLYNTNVERKRLTKEHLDIIVKGIEQSSYDNDKVIVVFNEFLHESLAGNVASRIKDKYNRPVIVLTRSEDGAKGSGRSIEKYNLHEALTKNKHLLKRFGGHKMSVGLSMDISNISVLRQNLNEQARFNIEEDDILVNKLIPLKDATYELYEQFSLIEPFGKGMKRPILASFNVEVVSLYFDALKNYFKLEVVDNSVKKSVTSIAFGLNERFEALIRDKYNEYDSMKILGGAIRTFDLRLDIVYTLDYNEYGMNKSMQLRLIDFRFST